MLRAIPPELSEINSDFDLDLEQSNGIIKTLGINLCPMKDEFQFKVSSIESFTNDRCFTKRMFLSESSRIFDPLGLLSPVLITAKIMFQQLWLSEISWDDPLPESLFKS